MFELCKKIEVYNIENNYYYYRSTPIQSQLSTKLGLHLLKIQSINSINNNKISPNKKLKKGIKLSNTIDCIPKVNNKKPVKLDPHRVELQKYKQQEVYHQLSTDYKDNLSRLRTATEQNQLLITSLYNNGKYSPFSNYKVSPVITNWDYKVQSSDCTTSRIQKINIKTKPTIQLDITQSKDNKPILKKQSQGLQQANKNLYDTTKPPIASKIQTCYTNGLPSSQHLISKHQPQITVNFHENVQNQQSKLISISKSVSSVHETINQKQHRRYDILTDQISKSVIQFSISLSNVFSKQQSGLDGRKLYKQNSMKRLSLFLDSQRHTIQSRVSREIQVYDQPKIQQSFICNHDPKQKFIILQSNKITKKDYVMNLAVQKNIHFVVSLKQIYTNQLKSIVQQLHIYQLIQKNLYTRPQYRNILQLYQVQISEGSYLFIKQPYQMSLQAKLKQTNTQQTKQLRQTAKTIALFLLQFLEQFGIFANRKITTHQFVMCMDQPKIHDLSLFYNQPRSILTKEEIVSGIDI